MGSIKDKIAAFETAKLASSSDTSTPPVVSLQALTQGSIQAARNRASSTSSSASSNSARQPGADAFGRPSLSVGNTGVRRSISASSIGTCDGKDGCGVQLTLNGNQVGDGPTGSISPRLRSSQIISLYSSAPSSPSQRFILPSALSSKPPSGPPPRAPKPLNLQSPTVHVETATPAASPTLPSSTSFPSKPAPPLPARKSTLPPTLPARPTPSSPTSSELPPIKRNIPLSRAPSSYRKPPPPFLDPLPSSIPLLKPEGSNSTAPPLPTRKPTMPQPEDSPNPISTQPDFPSPSSVSSKLGRRVPPPPPRQSSQSSTRPQETARSLSGGSLSGNTHEEEDGLARRRYDRLFTKLISIQRVSKINATLLAGGEVETTTEEGGRLAPAVVKGIWERSRLDALILRSVWDKADPDRTGSLDRDAFGLGMGLIDQELKRRAGVRGL